MALKMNYKPNKLALALKSGKSHNVGVIVPRINRNFFSYIIRGIEEELYPHGYHVIICQTYDDGEREIENVAALLNAQVDGIFMSFSGSTSNFNHLKRVVDKNVPLIFFDRKMNLDGVSSVTINDFKGGYEATTHLIEQGCERIAHLSCNQTLEIYRDRFDGYKQALLDHHMDFDKKYVIETKNDVDGGKSSAKKLLKLDNPPDAIFSSSDFVALGAIQEIKSQGYKIPNDICVSGFSNEPFTKFMELSITSVDQFPLDMGKMVAKVFLEQVKDKGVKIEKKVVLNPKLHIRKSSAKKIKV
jgi:LacI family transcriptional regulator